MAISVNPLHPLFAAEIVGADLTVPPSAGLVDIVENAMNRFGVCIVRDASRNDDDHIRFSRAFGPLEWAPQMSSAVGMPSPKRRLRPELFDASNLDAEGKIMTPEQRKLAQGAERFHSDSSFNPLPTKWSLLLGHEVPPVGGDTHFVDTRVAHERLDDATRAQIEDLIVIHDFWRGRELAGLKGVTDAQRATLPPVEHKLVRTHPSGRRGMHIGGHACRIKGMGDEAGLALLDKLYAVATAPDMIYAHKWRRGDLVIWDNRATLHAATRLDSSEYVRDVRRTTINESGEERRHDWIAAA